MKQAIIGLILTLGTLPAIAATGPQDFSSILWHQLVAEKPDASIFDKVNLSLNDDLVVIPGFVVRSIQDGKEVFVLSKQRKVCEHSPRPHANQMIKMSNPKGITLKEDDQTPIYAFGKLKIEETRAGLFSSAYTLELVNVEAY